MSVGRRARSHEDRGGDPLDGLVNLFDLGIVLAVAFLLAALSSFDLTEVLTERGSGRERRQAANAVTVAEDEQVREIELEPGERVVGNGEAVGRSTSSRTAERSSSASARRAGGDRGGATVLRVILAACSSSRTPATG